MLNFKPFKKVKFLFQDVIISGLIGIINVFMGWLFVRSWLEDNIIRFLTAGIIITVIILLFTSEVDGQDYMIPKQYMVDYPLECPDDEVVEYKYLSDTLTLTVVYWDKEWIHSGISYYERCAKKVRKEVYEAEILTILEGVVNPAVTLPETFYFAKGFNWEWQRDTVGFIPYIIDSLYYDTTLIFSIPGTDVIIKN